MSKTVAEYLATHRTANQEAFLSWVVTETGLTFKSANEQKAFELGVRCAGLYSRFQVAKRDVAPPVEPEKAAPSPRKPRSKQNAA